MLEKFQFQFVLLLVKCVAILNPELHLVNTLVKTLYENKYQIKKIIRDEDIPYTYLGFVGEYKGSNTKVELLCAKHGVFSTTVSNFINSGSRCPDCTVYGYKPSKPGFLYILKVLGINSSFTGYGITNNLPERLKKHTRNLELRGFCVVTKSAFKMGGQDAVDIENSLKDNFPRDSQDVEGFITEATHYHLFDDVVNFVTLSQSPHKFP